MTTSLYTLASYIKIPHLTPESEAVQEALRLAASEFCRRTGAWKATLTASPTAGALSVALTLPVGFTGNLGRLRAVRVDDGTDEEKVIPLEDVSLNPALTLSWTRWEPVGGETVYVDCTLWPSLAVSAYDAEVVSRWSQALIFGAKALLHGEIAGPWSNPSLKPELSDKFEEQISTALGQGDNLNPRRFFHGRPRSFAGPEPAGPISQGARYLRRSIY